jgi:hypothetical protein
MQDFLKIALEAIWWRSEPLSVTIPLCKRIRQAIPKMKKIWELSQFAKIRDPNLAQALEFEQSVSRSILEGQLTLDDAARPEEMVGYPHSGEKSTLTIKTG